MVFDLLSTTGANLGLRRLQRVSAFGPGLLIDPPSLAVCTKCVKWSKRAPRTPLGRLQNGEL